MNANYKRICEILEEAQGVLDRLQLIDKDYQKRANLKGLLNGLDKLGNDWGMTIRKLASIIRQLG